MVMMMMVMVMVMVMVVKSPFPVLTRDWNKLLFFFRPREVVNFRLKSLLETTFAQSQQIYPFDDWDTHTRSIDLVGVESAHSLLVRLGFEPATMLFVAAVMDKSRDSHK